MTPTRDLHKWHGQLPLTFIETNRIIWNPCTWKNCPCFSRKKTIIAATYYDILEDETQQAFFVCIKGVDC